MTLKLVNGGGDIKQLARFKRKTAFRTAAPMMQKVEQMKTRN